MADRLQIKGKIYKAEDLDGVKLSDTFAFDEQVWEFRHSDDPDANAFPDVAWADLEEAINEIRVLAEKDEKAAGRHRRANLVLTATIWLTLRRAGDALTVGEIINLNMGDDIRWLPDTKDNKSAADAVDPTRRPADSRASEVAASVPKPPVLIS